MSDTVSSISTFQAGSAFQLKVGARGALIRAFFGSGAMYCGVVFSGTKNWPWFASVTVASAALIAWAVRSIRATRPLRSSDDDMVRWRSVRTFYLLDFALEWAFIAAAFIALVKFERVDLAPQVLGLIIGLHYLPLSRIFGLRQYAWTGCLLIAGALGSLFIPRGQSRNIVGFALLGSILWATCAVILWSISLVLRDQTAA